MATYASPYRSRNPLKSVADYEAEYDARDLARQKIAANALSLDMDRAKMAADGRIVADSNALRGVVAGFGPDRAVNTRALLGAGRLTEAETYEKTGAALVKSGAEADKLSAETLGIRISTIDKKLAQHKSLLPQIQDPQQMAAWVAAAHQDPDMGPIVSKLGTMEDMIARIPQTQAEFGNFRLQVEAGTEKLRSQLAAEGRDLQTRTHQQTTAAETGRHNRATETTAAGQLGVSRDRLAFDKTKPASGGGSDGGEGAGEVGKGLVVVRDEGGKLIPVSRAEAVRRGAVPVDQDVALPPKEIQKREVAYPKSHAAVKGVEDDSTSLEQDLRDLAKHPGLSGMTGVAFGRTPSLYPESREAHALYDKIRAKGGFQALQAMRQSNPTGGALGSVSNQEGTRLENSFAAIDRTQTADSVAKALIRAADDAKTLRIRAREAFDETYEYRGNRAPGAAPGGPAAPGGVDPEDWKHMTPQERALWQKR